MVLMWIDYSEMSAPLLKKIFKNHLLETRFKNI